MDPNKESDSVQSKNKKKRRPRSAAGERNYICGCGKAYLSYPALYTHVKNKHEGIFPIGSNAKREIPRNAEENIELLFNPDLKKFFEEFAEFVSEIEKGENILKRDITAADLDVVFEIGSFKDFKDNKVFRNFFESSILLFKNKSSKIKEQKENMNIYQILSHFLCEIFPYCSIDLFKEFFIIIYTLIHSINDKGHLFKEKEEKSSKQNDRFFCESTEFIVVTKMINLFIAEIFPEFLKLLKDKNKFNFKFLGFEDENIKNLILMCKFLGNWMFHSKFSPYRMEINVDF
jgi:hypothetical protein